MAGLSTRDMGVADTLAGQDLCTGKGPGAKPRVGIALPPDSAPASPTTSSWDHFSFLFNCKMALTSGGDISPGKLQFKAKSPKP